jgi:uncharacterized protein (DUF849 family)
MKKIDFAKLEERIRENMKMLATAMRVVRDSGDYKKKKEYHLSEIELRSLQEKSEEWIFDKFYQMMGTLAAMEVRFLEKPDKKLKEIIQTLQKRFEVEKSDAVHAVL